MKIRLRVNPKLTKDELLQRLPDMAKAIVEAMMEKGVSLSASIEGTHKSHPVRAIAAAEDEVYDQGSDALAGIYSWLLRKLNVEVKKGGDLSEDDFRHEMLEQFGVKLGSSVDRKQAQDIAEVLSMFPSDAMDGRVETISVNKNFGASKRAYPNHGRYYEDAKRIVLNPHIFGEETDYTTDSGEKIEKLMHTLVHEIGHSIDDKHGLSKKKEWRGISGWRYIGDREPEDNEERMLLKEGDVTTLKGRWAYRKGTNFPRWYGARNPKEDFCEAFAFAFLGATHYFKGQTGEAKLAFIKKVIAEMQKSQAPGLSLESVGVSDLEKSQEFWSYTSARAATLVDDEDVSQEAALSKAANEFTFEPCEDLLLEKAEGETPKPTATPAAPAAGAPAAGPNPTKGQQKPGHKYLKRETLPNGKYRYWYQMPTGELYFSDDKELHDPAKHKEQFPATHQFENFKAGIHPSKVMGEAPEGLEHHHFDGAEVPNLVNDIQPHDKQFDPKATPDEKQKAAEESKVEPAKKEKREHEDLLLREADHDRILQAQGSWEIESVDYEFGKAGVQLSMRVKIKNDGEAMLKPEAGAEKFGEHGGHRGDIKEWSTVFREALASNIDRALGWNLVPPTSIRKLKGDSLKRILEYVKKKEGENSSAYKALKNKTHVAASMQFFAKGGERYGDHKGAEMAPKVKEDEVIRGALFDMIINHQDRHNQNLLIGPDVDSSNRYGGSHRMVFIDNGYAFGNGARGISDVADMSFKNVRGKFIDQNTLRDLRKLRDDLHSKVRRRKIVPEEIRAKVPWDQVIRVAHRIDYILSDKNRDGKGRVRVPDWYTMQKWEQENYPAKFSRGMDREGFSKAFDLSGKTCDLNFHAQRKLDEPKARVPKFKSGSAVQDFLHPLLEHLNARGKERVKAIYDAFESKHHGNLYSAMENFIRKSPKKLVNQLVNNQLFLERIGIEDKSVKDLKRAAKDMLNRDLVGEFEGYLRQAGGVDAVQKHARGELSESDVIKLVGEERFNRFQDRWAVHPKLRGLGKDKLSAIFEDPEAFGWGKKGPKKEKVKKEFWHQEQEKKNPNWHEGKGKHLPPGEGPLKKSEEPELVVKLDG